jgi:hypothetical protein
MPLAPEHYLNRAADIEVAAKKTRDPVLRQGYLDLAAQYRDMATRAAAIRTKAAELDLLAENMVGINRKTL